jgi:predicted exporter
MVGILADRAPPTHRVARVPFLGAMAAFPTGPLRLTAALGAPVVLCFGLRRGTRRYTVIFEPFAGKSGDSVAALVSLASLPLVAGLLIWRFRSPLVLAVLVVPVLLGLAAALVAVQLTFGFVHGIALGFGITMLGVTLDYPVLLVGHRKPGEAPAATLRRIGRAFALAVLTGDARRLLRVEGLRAWRWCALAVPAGAVLLLYIVPPRWQGSLATLSPVPPTALALDAELRGALGAPDGGMLGLVRAEDAEAVLRQEEALLPVLDQLAATGALGGAELAARLLPSRQTQRARQAALPDRSLLAARVADATGGLGFRPGAFQPFLDDVAASATLPPLGPGDLADPAVRARVSALVFPKGAAWYGLIAPVGLRDPRRE